MNPSTRKAEKAWDRALLAKDRTKLHLDAAQQAFTEATREEAKAREEYEWALQYDGLDFDERQTYRRAFHAVLSGLPA